ncbi:hypothetical protein Pfo_023470 [Paulownia fortunei]|nr:hypothetical protein Pfo_023470 [Paulownia fortunei]
MDSRPAKVWFQIISLWAEEVDKHAVGISKLFWEVCAIGCVLSRYSVIWFHLINFVKLSYLVDLYTCYT